jgi:hypothetical protein
MLATANEATTFKEAFIPYYLQRSPLVRSQALLRVAGCCAFEPDYEWVVFPVELSKTNNETDPTNPPMDKKYEDQPDSLHNHNPLSSSGGPPLITLWA